MKLDYKIGDLVVFVDSIADSAVRTVDETPSNDGRFVVLDGFRNQYGTQFIRPATVQERQLNRRIIASA